MISTLCRFARPALIAICTIVAIAAVHAIAMQPLPPEWQAKLDAALSTHQKCALAVNKAQELTRETNALIYGDWLLGIASNPPSREKRSSAKSLLAYAEGRLSELSKRDRKAFKARISLLRRFDAVFAAISAAPSTSSQPDVADLNDAAADLAEYLDDPNAALAESARLWQAAAYWRAGNTERALKTLRPIVSDPVHPRIGFVSRLFRVRLLALSGQPAAALADSSRIADRVDRWFTGYSEETRESARSAVREMQIAIYESWKARLSGESDEPGKEAVANRLAELKKETLVPDAAKRFRLRILIGGLAPLEIPANEPSATTQPATDDE